MTERALSPGVGDLVELGSTSYIVSDISGSKTNNPIWEMRPQHGNAFSRRLVSKENIGEWKLMAKCGAWE